MLIWSLATMIGPVCDNKVGIEQAFRETCQGIKPTDGMIVGIYDRYSDQPSEDADLVRRFGSEKTA